MTVNSSASGLEEIQIIGEETDSLLAPARHNGRNWNITRDRVECWCVFVGCVLVATGSGLAYGYCGDLDDHEFSIGCDYVALPLLGVGSTALFLLACDRLCCSSCG